MSKYIVDSNFFIQAHRSAYPFDVMPSFWNKVKELAEDGKIISIDKVKIEICTNDDELKHWCVNSLPPEFFCDTSTVLQQYGIVVSWAASKSAHYLAHAIAEFMDATEADAWLVAYALADASSRTIVTHEISEPNRRNKVKIPDACIAQQVSYLNTIDMFRQLGVRL